MYKIKQIAGDFIVKEVANIRVKDKGKYAYYKLKKKNWNTLDVIREISKRLKVPNKNIGFAGSKDKKAITEQMISVKNKKIRELGIKDVSLEFVGYGDEPITLGELTGNHFEIVVRNLDDFEFEVPAKIINYFDEQRFGGNNVEVGRSMIKKDFQKTCVLLELEVRNNDYIGALKKIPMRLLRMYVHAYQSYLWNETVKETIKQKIEVEEVPLVGLMTEFDDDLKEIIENILDQEKLTLNDFIIKQIPQLSLEGDLRKVFVEVKEFKVLDKSDDELNEGKKKVKISFKLGKGSYATLVVKNIWG